MKRFSHHFLFLLFLGFLNHFNSFAQADEIPQEIRLLLAKNMCISCHTIHEKFIGPSYVEIGERNYSVDQMMSLIKSPIPQNWPDYQPMTPLPYLPKDEVKKIAEWIATLNKTENVKKE